MSETIKKKVVIPFRSLLKWLVRLRRSPKSIAGGFALGTFVAFTPTIGIQFAIVIFLATLLNMNRPAALITIWITNVATMAPIYTFNYWVGSLFVSGPSVGSVYRRFLDVTAKLMSIDVWQIMDQFKAVLGLGREIFIPLVIGSLLVGLLAALVVYVLALVILRYLLERRRSKQLLN